MRCQRAPIGHRSHSPRPRPQLHVGRRQICGRNDNLAALRPLSAAGVERDRWQHSCHLQDQCKGTDFLQLYVGGSFAHEGRPDLLYDAEANLHVRA